MFGNASIPSIVYSYGARRPIDGLSLVREQMHLAHRYRNSLVELERERRARTDTALAEMFPDLAAVERNIARAEADLTASRAVITSANAAARSIVATPEMKTTTKAHVMWLRELRATRKTLRKASFASEEWKTRQEQVETWARAEQKRRRAASGLSWGTYLHVETSLRSCRTGAPPQFMRADGSGHLAIQLQLGATWGELTSEADTRLRLVPDEPSALSIPGSRRHGTHYTCWWRIGSDGRNPVWAKFPVVLHRPVPSDARVKWAHLLREVVGTVDRWTLQLVISREAGWAKPDVAKSGACGLDIGWRRTGEGLRVAVWVGDDGKDGDLVLPQWWLDGWIQTENLRAIRDGEFNAARERLAAWVESDACTDAALRAACNRTWTDERGNARATHIRQWREPEKLVRVWWGWRKNRFAGDATEFDLLTRWAVHERHLHDYEDSLREQLQAQRLDLYRRFVAALRRRYRTVAIEDRKQLDLSRFQALPPPEGEAPIAAAREHQRDACCHVLRGLLAQSIADLRDAEMRGSTMECHACGLASDFDRADMMRTCPGCGHVHDQDWNAAVVLLRRATGGSSGPMATEPLDPLAECGNPVARRDRSKQLERMRRERDGARAEKVAPLENVDVAPALE